MIPTNGDLAATLTKLRQEHAMARISCVGGRTIATTLVDAGLVQDLYLTTSAIDGGEPGTPWYLGRNPPGLSVIVRKREDTPDRPILWRSGVPGLMAVPASPDRSGRDISRTSTHADTARQVI